MNKKIFSLTFGPAYLMARILPPFPNWGKIKVFLFHRFLVPTKGLYPMRYLINLIDVDGTQLVFSSELALNLADTLRCILRLQSKAITETWFKARITVEAKGVSLAYEPLAKVDYQTLEHDVIAQLEAAIDAAINAPCPPAPALPYGWDFVDQPDPAWAEPYDAD